MEDAERSRTRNVRADVQLLPPTPACVQRARAAAVPSDVLSSSAPLSDQPEGEKLQRTHSLRRKKSSRSTHTSSSQDDTLKALNSLKDTVQAQGAALEGLKHAVDSARLEAEDNKLELAKMRLHHQNVEFEVLKKVAIEVEKAKAVTTVEVPTAYEPDDALFADSADSADIANFYSFGIETLLVCKSFSTMFSVFVSLVFLLFIQIVYAYAFHDASLLLAFLDNFSAFKDPIDLSLFYASNVPEGTTTPLINMLASMVSLALLAISFKNDNEGTMLTTCPLEFLLLPSMPPAAIHATEAATINQRGVTFRSACLSSVRGVLCIALQFLWSARVLLLPIYAGLGTAGAFVASNNAQDVVLNSVAISFVFELDEVLYEALLPRASREAFEESAPPPTSPLAPSNKRAKRAAASWGWFVWLIDVLSLFYYYLANIYTPKLNATEAEINAAVAGPPGAGGLFILSARLVPVALFFRAWFWARCFSMVLAQLHLAILSGRIEAGVSKLRFGFGCLIMAIGILTVAFVVYIWAMGWLEFFAGFNAYILASNQAFACLFGVLDDEIACAHLHQTPGFYQTLKPLFDSIFPGIVRSAFDNAWSYACLNNLGSYLNSPRNGSSHWTDVCGLIFDGMTVEELQALAYA